MLGSLGSEVEYKVGYAFERGGCCLLFSLFFSFFDSMQFWNKRVMAGSTFDVHRAEPSQQQFMVTPPLDMHRAESSRQHVRALNTQFARFVLIISNFSMDMSLTYSSNDRVVDALWRLSNVFNLAE